MAKTTAKKAAKPAAKKKNKAQAPARKAAKAPAGKAAKAPAGKAAKTAQKNTAKKPAKQKMMFRPGDFVVYPTHGVGQVTSIEIQEIAGHKLKLFVISFENERMTLRVPIAKVTTSGLRKLSSRKVMDTAMEKLNPPTCCCRRATWWLLC